MVSEEMTAEQALEIARAAWGPGARVTLIAVGTPNVPDDLRERARLELAEFEAREPKLMQPEDAPPGMTMGEYQEHRRAWWEAYERHREREQELAILAYGFLMSVERPGYATTAHIRSAHSWQDALRQEGLLAAPDA